MRRSKDYIFYVKKAGVWMPIACEISSAMNETVEMVSTTTRDNAGWETSKPTLQQYSLNIQAAVSESDVNMTFFELRRIKRNRNLIEWKRQLTDNSYFEYGLGYITAVSDSASVDDDITFSFSIQGFGKPLEDLEGLIYVIGTSANEALVNELNQMLRVYA